MQILSFTEPVAIIGDIHGQAGMLQRMLDLLGNRPVLVTGDIGDRGPDTKGVLDLLVNHQAKGVLGNHDDWFRQFAIGGAFDSYALDPVMGGVATLKSYRISSRLPSIIETQYLKIPTSHREWLLALTVLIDLEVQGKKYWLTHAGVPSGLPGSEMTAMLDMPLSETIWECRKPKLMKAVDRPVIMGHMIQEQPVDLGHVIVIDTGAGLPGRNMTALLLPERSFLQVKP
jgi:serine/threonine protein phosphatase 1